jgi:hypothetical protein
MPKNLGPADFDVLGAQFPCAQMDNGEYRLRLMRENYGYIMTIAGKEGAWQNSHYHNGVRETYIVQTGWMAMAELEDDGSVIFHVFKEGGIVTTEPGMVHNVYLPAGAVIHTVKHGDVSAENDWHASPELDVKTKLVTEEQLLQL